MDFERENFVKSSCLQFLDRVTYHVVISRIFSQNQSDSHYFVEVILASIYEIKTNEESVKKVESSFACK